MNEGINTTNTEPNLEEARKRGYRDIDVILHNTYLLGNNDSEPKRIELLRDQALEAPDVETINRLIEEAGGIRSSKQRDNPFDVIDNDKKTN